MAKHKLKRLRIKELSQVDAGANQEAQVVLMKRDIEKAETKREADQDFPAAAFAYVPDPESPSTWKLRLWDSLESKETAAQVGRALAAIGPGFRGNKVQIPSKDMASVKRKILAAWRKTHETGTETPSALKQENDMNTEELAKRLEDMEEEVTTLKSKNESLEKERDEALAKAGMSDAEKAHYDSLDDVKKGEFLAMSSEDRQTAMEPPMNDVDKRFDAELKKRDEEIEKAMKENEILKAKFELSELSKRAETEYPNIPGDPVAKAKLLKSIESIEDEDVRKSALAIMKSHNDTLAKDMLEVGKSGGADTTASDELENMAKKYADENSVDISKAYDAVLNTAEGKKLYEQTLSH